MGSSQPAPALPGVPPASPLLPSPPHLHSSLSSCQAPALVLNTPNMSRAQAKLRLSLIYKDVDQTTLLVSPGRQIRGEANLLRYLARIFPNNLYENSDLLTKIDEVLDSLSVADSKHAVTK